MTNRKIEYWVIPPQADAEFTAGMEEVLDTCAQPYDAAKPVLCMDKGQIDRRQQSSINYIERSQRYFGWGFLGKDNSPRYAAMFFIRGRKMPEMSWMAVEKYPREFIFTPTNTTLRNNFVRLPQIRCPLYGPLPKALYAAYEKLLNNRSKEQRPSGKGK